MSYTVQPRQETCNMCGSGPVPPKINQQRVRDKIIHEAVWVCNSCGAKFKRGVIKEETIEKKD